MFESVKSLSALFGEVSDVFELYNLGVKLDKDLPLDEALRRALGQLEKRQRGLVYTLAAVEQALTRAAELDPTLARERIYREAKRLGLPIQEGDSVTWMAATLHDICEGTRDGLSNLYDDHADLEREIARQEEYLEETRDLLHLAEALANNSATGAKL